MIFAPVGIVEAMVIRFREHVINWGNPPQDMYLLEEDYVAYENYIRKHYPDNPTVDFKRLVFRGVNVLKLEDKHEVPAR